MTGDDNRRVVERYVAAMNARDMEARDALLHDDVVEIYPQSGERFSGRGNLRAMLELYPNVEGETEPSDVQLATRDDRWVMTPAFTVVPAIGLGQDYTVTGRIRYPNGEEWHLIQLIQLRDGLIWRFTSYFAAPFEAPDWRAPFRDAMREAGVEPEGADG